MRTDFIIDNQLIVKNETPENLIKSPVVYCQIFHEMQFNHKTYILRAKREKE